ncbi:MAG: hypothetical protein M3R48_09280 [Candidatus Dormibacteraeota bacterium]|nr:hypothetical protein [Candidatus Dormibacteraeota bacterium]
MIYWRAGAQRRSRQLAVAVEDAITEGRAAAEGAGAERDDEHDRFGQD